MFLIMPLQVKRMGPLLVLLVFSCALQLGIYTNTVTTNRVCNPQQWHDTMRTSKYVNKCACMKRIRLFIAGLCICIRWRYIKVPSNRVTPSYFL